MTLLIRHCRNRVVCDRMHGKFKPIWSDRTGTTAIEYAMIALFVGLLLISLQTSIGNSVVGFFMSVATGL